MDDIEGEVEMELRNLCYIRNFPDNSNRRERIRDLIALLRFARSNPRSVRWLADEARYQERQDHFCY